MNGAGFVKGIIKNILILTILVPNMYLKKKWVKRYKLPKNISISLIGFQQIKGWSRNPERWEKRS